MRSRTVIVGASLGGTRTARALRATGYSGEIVVVGDEATLPYDRPPLSKAFLAGTSTPDAIVLLDEEAARTDDVRLELGQAATRLDLAGRSVELADGTRLHFDHLVIATGARARPSPWGSHPGVHLLRTVADAVALASDLRRGGPLVIIGAGFIGSEVAATAKTMGVEDVTVVDPMPVPLSRVLNPGIAELFGRLHHDHGVATRFGVGVEKIDTSGEQLVVQLSDGTDLPATTVLVGIGAIPNDEWLAGSGLTIDDGVVCDRYSRAVDAPFVYAVGDVARWWHPRHRRLVRAEHWTNAAEQATCVAHNIVHPDDLREYCPVEYVWSDQYDWKIQLAGRTGGDLTHTIVEGSEPARSFAVLYADTCGDFAGAVTANWPRALLVCRRALGTPTRLDAVKDAVEAAAARSLAQKAEA